MMKVLNNVAGLKTLWLVMVIQFWPLHGLKPRCWQLWSERAVARIVIIRSKSFLDGVTTEDEAAVDELNLHQNRCDNIRSCKHFLYNSLSPTVMWF